MKRVGCMFFVALIIFVITLFFISRFYSLKKEIRKMTSQLYEYTTRKTNKKINMSLFDRDLEHLGLELNKLIDLYVAENRKRVLFEEEQKRAIANMSHDLRTPLTSIIGYIQMAERDDVSEEERKELLETAKKRAKRLEMLLNDFFELSIIESTDHPLKLERLSLTKMTTDVLIGFYDRFQENKLEPSINMPDKDVIIIADESAVIRVMENLLTNAIHHSDGNIKIVLEEDETTASFIVKNDAFSLTDQDVERMFDRFFMADVSRSGKSTGLGLSISKSLMEKMNGTITANLVDGQLSIRCRWRKENK